MTTHAEQPRLCAQCLAIVHALAESGLPDDRVIKRCPHNGVIAVVAKRAGAIVHWHLEGPVSDAQAEEIGAKIFAQFAQAGLSDHTPTRQ